MKRVYDPDEDDHILKPKDNFGPKAVVTCWACGKTFENETALKTHMNKHCRENISTTNDYVTKSSFNQTQIYITKLKNELIEKVNESVDYILGEFIPIKSYKYKVTVNCLYKRRKLAGDPKTTSINFKTEEYMTKHFQLDLNQWLDYFRETCEG